MTRRKAHTLVVVLTLVAALVCGWAITHAGEVNLSWNASTTATGYKIYSGTSSGNYSPNPADVGNVTSAPLTGLADGCIKHYAAVTAYNAAGESGFSNEVSFYPRPLIAFVTSPAADPGNLHINGGNFAPEGLTVYVDGAEVAATRESCELVKTPAQPWVTVKVCNATVCATHVLQPPDAPQNVAIN